MDAENLKLSVNDNIDTSFVLCRVMYTLMDFLCIVLFHKKYIVVIYFFCIPAQGHQMQIRCNLTVVQLL